MLSRFYAYKQILIGMFLAIVVASTAGCISPVSPDTVKEGIPLEEAQGLLPFKVCLPEFVPNGVNISETVLYHDEFGDPYESDITIDYFGGDKENAVFTIYERHGPGVRSDFHDSTTQRVSMRRLMDWRVDWKTIEDFENQIDELDKNGVVEYQIYTFDSERLIVEIKSPEALKATMITWRLSENVLIDVYSHLSVEETKLIANSVPNCNPVPTVTP